MSEAGKRARFEALVLPHLGAGYNLARWILKEEVAAEDVVQEASLRAFRFFDGMHGGSARPWFLAVVRNACLDRLQERRRHAADESYDEDAHGAPDEPQHALMGAMTTDLLQLMQIPWERCPVRDDEVAGCLGRARAHCRRVPP